MKTWTKRAAVLAFVIGCLVSLRGQTSVQTDTLEGLGKSVRAAFERRYPPDRTYAVVVRADLPALGKSARESGYPIEIGDSEWKGPGSMFRAKPAGNLALGDVLKVERVEYSKDSVELRLVSVDPRQIVVDPDRPDRNRQEQLVTRLTVPHDAGIARLVERLDAYVRLFPGLDQAREYAAHLREPQSDRRFTLAVVRRDGILVPIANYDNGHWFRRWPLPAADREVPIGMSDIPAQWWGIEGPAQKWTLWTLDGKARPLQVTGPLAFGAHCLMNVGLRSDYRTLLPHPPLDQHHYPKDGIATTGSLPIEAATILTADSDTWTTFEPLIAPHIDRLEAAQAIRIPPSVLVERAVTPVKLEVLCMADGAAAGTFAAYFEAARRYPPPDKTVANPCGIITFAHGWVHRGANGIGTLDRNLRVQVTDCTMWDVEFRKPLGVLRVGDAPIWVMEVSRWGAEWYELVQVTGTTVTTLLAVPGGSCRTLGG